MFGFLKKKLKEGIDKISKTVSKKEEEKIEEAVEEVKKEEHIEEPKEELVEEVEEEIEEPEEIPEVEEKPEEVIEEKIEEIEEKVEEIKEEKKIIEEKVEEKIKPEIKKEEKPEVVKEEIKPEIVEEVKPEIKEEIKPEKKVGILKKIKKKIKPKKEKPKKKGILEKIKRKLTEKKITEDDVKDILYDLEVSLISSDVAVEVAEKITKDLKNNLVGKFIKRGKIEKIVKESIRKSILEILDVETFDLLEKVKTKKPFLILFLGFNGVGKTLSLSKLTKYLKDNGLRVLLAAGDTWRAGAITQLEEYAKKIGVEVIKQKYGSDPCAVIYDSVLAAKARGYDTIIADSAGRSHSNVNLADEMKKIVRVNKPDLKILVIDCLSGNDVISQTITFDKMVGVNAIILTKADVYDKGGAIISAVHSIKKPVIFLGTGQNLDDFEFFKPEKIVKNLFT